jgi:S1-C subfamily serine protease
MKIERSEFQGEFERTPQGRSERMNALLALWSHPRFWSRTDSQYAHRFATDENRLLSPSELRVWRALLSRGEPIPPRTFAPGLRRLLEVTESPHSIGDLATAGAIRIVGDRVSILLRHASAAVAEVPHADGWTFFIVSDDEALSTLLEKRFREVWPVSTGYLCSGPWQETTWEDASFLLGDAADAISPETALRVWRSACAVGVEELVLAHSTNKFRQVIVASLSEELVERKDSFKLETDVSLAGFREGLEYTLFAIPLPACRFNELRRARWQISRTRRSLDNDYFSTVVRCAMLAGAAHELGNLLIEMPPGALLGEALETLTAARPELLSALCFHPAWRVEATHALAYLPSQDRPQGRFLVDRDEEWLEVQDLARWQMVSGQDDGLDNPLALANAVALAIRDEQHVAHANGGRRRRIERPQLEPERIFAAWSARLHQEDQAGPCVKVVSGVLRDGPVPEGLMTFALRMVDALAASRPDLARELAIEIVEAYSRGLRPHAASIGKELGRQGALLAAFARVLATDTSAWEKLVAPFDLSSLLASAKTELPETVAVGTFYPRLHVPEMIGAHAQVLLAMAEYAERPILEELLDAVCVMYFAERAADLPVPAFSWWASSQAPPPGEAPSDPVLVTLGNRLSRCAQGGAFVRKVLRTAPDLLSLTWLLLGMGAEHPLRELLVPNIQDLVAERDEDELHLGEASTIANALWRASLPEQAEVYARAMLGIASSVARPALAAYRDAALTLIAVCLAAQNRWEDVLRLESPNGHEPPFHARNTRVVALIHLGNFDTARGELLQIIERDRRNVQALANCVTVEVRAGRWAAAITAAKHARTLLGDETPEEVSLMEVLAQSHLDNRSPEATNNDRKASPAVVPAREIGRTDDLLKSVLSAARGSIVFIYSAKEKGAATGFIVAPGVVLTAKHVMENVVDPRVALADDTVVPIESFTLIESDDLAFVHLQKGERVLQAPSLVIADSVADLDSILVPGFPPVAHSQKASLIPLTGTTVGAARIRKGEDVVLLSCITRGGYSGAPVLNVSGQVVGVVCEALFTRQAENDHVAEGLGFSAAVAAHVLRQHVQAHLAQKSSSEA